MIENCFAEPKKKNQKWRKLNIRKYVEWFDKTYGCNTKKGGVKYDE